MPSEPPSLPPPLPFPPRPLPALLFPPARPIGVVSDKIYPYFIANAAATDVPARLRINYSISVRRSPRSVFACSNTIGENNSRRNGHYVIA